MSVSRVPELAAALAAVMTIAYLHRSRRTGGPRLWHNPVAGTLFVFACMFVGYGLAALAIFVTGLVAR